MARPITAQVTRKLINYVRGEIKDYDYKIYTTDDEIFNKANKIQDEIAEHTFSIVVPDILNPLIPNQVDYSTLKLAPMQILRIEGVTIVAPDSTERGLKYAPKQVFETIKQNLHKNDTQPNFYTFDGTIFSIWKPYSILGYQIKIKASCLPQTGISYDQDPLLPNRYQKYLEYGTVFQCGASNKELTEKLNLEFYQKEFEKYKKSQVIQPSNEASYIPFNELQS